MLNNREHAFLSGRPVAYRLDDPTREAVRRDKLVSAWMPVVWSNDFGGVTLGVRNRTNYLGRYDRGLVLGSVGTASDAENRFGFYGRWSNPIAHLRPRATTSVAGWYVEGRAGVLLSMDRALRQHLGFGADPHAGFDALWMATTNLGYLDRRLWDDAGTVEGGPWIATTVQQGSAVVRARLGARAGLVYSNPGPGYISSSRYDVEAFGRFTGEASVRAPFPLGTRIGVRLFGGAYAGASPPVPQRRIPVAGADPYETFTNPLLRSAGALFVRPDFFYHAPGNGNLRGFRNDLGGRWALTANVELTRSVWPHDHGILRDVALMAFADGGIVDTLAVPAATAGRWYTPLYDGGVGVVTRHQIRDLAWTMRFELPLVVSRWDYAADTQAGDEGRLTFRWQVSVSPSF